MNNQLNKNQSALLNFECSIKIRLEVNSSGWLNKDLLEKVEMSIVSKFGDDWCAFYFAILSIGMHTEAKCRSLTVY